MRRTSSLLSLLLKVKEANDHRSLICKRQGTSGFRILRGNENTAHYRSTMSVGHNFTSGAVYHIWSGHTGVLAKKGQSLDETDSEETRPELMNTSLSKEG